MAGALSVVYNAQTPGMLRVAVFGAIPAGGDGVYVNLHFDTTGRGGDATKLTISSFILNDGNETVAVRAGTITITSTGTDGSLNGRLVTAFGRAVSGAVVSVTDSTRGRTRTAVSRRDGSFEFGSLTFGSTYTLRVSGEKCVFAPVTVSIAGRSTDLTLIAEE